jgi:hypothetical protein
VKSPQIATNPNRDKYSELKAIQSQAGWYVGSEYEDGSAGTRDSFGYYATNREARRALSLIRLGKMQTRLEP